MPRLSAVILFQVSVEYRSGKPTYTLTSGRKRVGKAIARCSRSATLVELLKDPMKC